MSMRVQVWVYVYALVCIFMGCWHWHLLYNFTILCHLTKKLDVIMICGASPIKIYTYTYLYACMCLFLNATIIKRERGGKERICVSIYKVEDIQLHAHHYLSSLSFILRLFVVSMWETNCLKQRKVQQVNKSSTLKRQKDRHTARELKRGSMV